MQRKTLIILTLAAVTTGTAAIAQTMTVTRAGDGWFRTHSAEINNTANSNDVQTDSSITITEPKKPQARTIDKQAQRALANSKRPKPSASDIHKKEREGFRNMSAKTRNGFRKFKQSRLPD